MRCRDDIEEMINGCQKIRVRLARMDLEKLEYPDGVPHYEDLSDQERHDYDLYYKGVVASLEWVLESSIEIVKKP